MKNFLIVFSVLIFSLAVLSCKKKYACNCVNTDPDTGEEYIIENPYLKKFNKSTAAEKKTNCEATPGCTFERYKD
jgi:hypothetical protein